MAQLPFVKYSGNGNDFVILDHPEVMVTPDLVQRLCSRHFGVGADGVLLVTNQPGVDLRMQIFNADGGEAEMCANGMRCLVTYWDEKSLVKKNSYLVKTMNGVYQVERKGKAFALEMSEIKDKNLYDLSEFSDFEKKFYINTGVPHLVFLGKDVKLLDIKKVGAFYRYHKMFPRGTNVSFVEVVDATKALAYVRTYERGVEDETHSCGTGLTAVGLALKEWLGWTGDMELISLGGKHKVSMTDKVMYSGEVSFCFRGELSI